MGALDFCCCFLFLKEEMGLLFAAPGFLGAWGAAAREVVEEKQGASDGREVCTLHRKRGWANGCKKGCTALLPTAPWLTRTAQLAHCAYALPRLALHCVAGTT